MKSFQGQKVQPLTLYEKLWSDHVVRTEEDGTALLYIDRHLVHEVTSPQAFEGLRLENRPVWRADSIVATADHNTPTRNEDIEIADPVSRQQVDALDSNIRACGALAYFPFRDPRQGIVHVVGPENGATLPGMTVVCGDSHTSTHGAFGCLAHGIGTSEVEHVLATQCLWQRKSNTMRAHFEGTLSSGVSAKDMALALISTIGTSGGTGYVIEFTGPAVSALSMEGRMTLCNMAIEAGARAGMVAVDQTTLDYLQHRPLSPQGQQWKLAVEHWRHLHSDNQARFDRTITLDVSHLAPQVTWGTSPEMVGAITDKVPAPEEFAEPIKRQGVEQALQYMGLKPHTALAQIRVDKIFIGSCTNARIEDLRIAAHVLKGRHIADNIKLAMVVPGSALVKRQAEAEGLDHIFTSAGCEWRQPGCSMCLGMNSDRLSPGERCASTSNRNFEGRQGAASRTHLVSPAMAAAAAVAGRFVDVRAFF